MHAEVAEVQKSEVAGKAGGDLSASVLRKQHDDGREEAEEAF